jgi:nitronate monooxygenase
MGVRYLKVDFSMLETRFTKLIGCKYPIQQAGMAAQANSQLASAVSNAGGLGMVSVGGFSPEGVTREMETMKRLTTHPFGTNFLIPEIKDEKTSETLKYENLEESVRAAARHSRLVEFFYRDPDPTLLRSFTLREPWPPGRSARSKRPSRRSSPDATS